MKMLEMLLPTILSFVITFFTLPVIIFIAKKKNLFDTPNERKVHTKDITNLGGFAIFAGFMLATLICVNLAKASEIQYFLSAALLLLFIGLKDDIIVISPSKKLVGQIIAAFLVIYKGGIQISSMHGFLGINELPHATSLLLTYFTILLIINSFNLIDGVDGLAGSLGLMVMILLGIYFIRIDMQPYGLLAFSLAGALVAFLIFNFEPAKIFMGDCGSLLIGLIVSVLVIKFINVAPYNDLMRVKSSPAIGFSLLMVPLLDTLRLFGLRIINRKSPFSPDKNHIHHILLKRSLSHRSVTLALLVANVLVILFSFVMKGWGSTFLIPFIISIYFIAVVILKYTENKKYRSERMFTKLAIKKEAVTKSIKINEEPIIIKES